MANIESNPPGCLTIVVFMAFILIVLLLWLGIKWAFVALFFA